LAGTVLCKPRKSGGGEALPSDEMERLHPVSLFEQIMGKDHLFIEGERWWGNGPIGFQFAA